MTISLILLAAASTRRRPRRSEPEAAAPAPQPGLYATIRTSMGDIFVKLFETETPITVQNFVDLARGTKAWKDPKTRQMVKRPLYPNTIFHRVMQGFMIQGGDPTGTGMGEIGYTIPEEFVPTLKFDQPGRLGMAKCQRAAYRQLAILHHRSADAASGRNAHGFRPGGGRAGRGEQNRASCPPEERQAADRRSALRALSSNAKVPCRREA